MGKKRVVRTDNILSDITIGEIIDTVEANCGSDVTEQDVVREFENILSANLKDARHILKKNMELILAEISGEKDDSNFSRVSKSEISKFTEYFNAFYGKHGLYPTDRDFTVDEVREGIRLLYQKYPEAEFHGDTIDRERVRDFLIKNGKRIK